MKADIITIGDEILIGQIIDTNSGYLASQLTSLGFDVRKIQSIPDLDASITETLNESVLYSDIVLITGGLGPTNDDITKKTLQRYFGGEFIYDADALAYIEGIYKKRGIPMTGRNRWQAAVPSSCTSLKNRAGSAPGMIFKKSNTIIVSLPGVPYEMKDIFSNELIPYLKKEFTLPIKIKRTILTTGIPESVIAEKLHNWEEKIPADMKLAYLPSPGIVQLRVSISGDKEDQLNNKLNVAVNHIIELLGKENIYGFDEDTLEGAVGQLLEKTGKTLAIAESCTGGYLAHRVTSVSGSSKYFLGSVTSYSNAVKQHTLGIQEKDIENYGAVSEEIVRQMAVGVQRLMGPDVAIATSGIAGPGGGTPEKPVGTVWIAVAYHEKVYAQKFLFGNDRERNIQMTSFAALNLLRNQLVKDVENIKIKS